MTDITFNNKAEPGKRFSLLNYCLSCTDLIPADKDFCSEGCENDFYRESELGLDEDETLIEEEGI
ncbi:MAG: hypothetical protein V3V81_07970 [Candidatus Bathyarchaeia archaeon]